MMEKSEAEIYASMIINAVCNHYNVERRDMMSYGRKQELANARQVAHYIVNRMLGRILTLVELGNIFKREHELILYSVNVVKNQMETYPIYQREIEDLCSNFKVFNRTTQPKVLITDIAEDEALVGYVLNIDSLIPTTDIDAYNYMKTKF